MGLAGPIDQLEVRAGGLTFTGRARGPRGGRPVLLLHGFPQTSWAWREVTYALAAADFRVMAPDQRGYSRGARPPNEDDYATHHLVADVLALADALEMDVFDLVGHDWGGMLAWLVASHQPRRVRSLSVVSTPHPLALQQAMRDDPEQTAWGEAMGSYRDPRLPERVLLGEDGSGSGLATLLAETGLDEVDTRAYVEAITYPGALTAALNWYRAMDGRALTGIGAVTVPTLYVWSTGDAAIGRCAAEATAAYVAGRYTFEVLEGVSHWIPETAPDALSELLLDHLAAT